MPNFATWLHLGNATPRSALPQPERQVSGIFPDSIHKADAIKALVSLSDGRNYLSFVEIEQRTGLFYSEIIALKPNLEQVLKVCVTSRVDLNPPGLSFDE
jgi:hypothetical protein